MTKQYVIIYKDLSVRPVSFGEGIMLERAVKRMSRNNPNFSELKSVEVPPTSVPVEAWMWDEGKKEIIINEDNWPVGWFYITHGLRALNVRVKMALGTLYLELVQGAIEADMAYFGQVLLLVQEQMSDEDWLTIRGLVELAHYPMDLIIEAEEHPF